MLTAECFLTPHPPASDSAEDRPASRTLHACASGAPDGRLRLPRPPPLRPQSPGQYPPALPPTLRLHLRASRALVCRPIGLRCPLQPALDHSQARPAWPPDRL